MLEPRSFKDTETRKSANLIAIDLIDYESDTVTVRNVGQFSGENCLMRVNGPTFSRNHAFLEYSDPSGMIGAYAFYRDGSKWVFVEKLHLGYW
ncbi:unnamed protein product [Ectocarpus sp. 12 AP-2014]